MSEMLQRNYQLSEAASGSLFLYPKTGREIYDYAKQFDEKYMDLIKDDVSTVAFLQLKGGELREPNYMADRQPAIDELVTINLDKRMVETSGYYAWQVTNGREQYDLLVGDDGNTHAVYCLKNKQNAVLIRWDVEDREAHQHIQQLVESIIGSDAFSAKVNRLRNTASHHAAEATKLVVQGDEHKKIMEGRSKKEKEYDAHISMVRRAIFGAATGDSTRYQQSLVRPHDWKPVPIYKFF